MLAARSPRLPPGAVQAVNWWILYAALPALVLALVPKVRIDAGSLFAVAAMWVVFFGAWLVFALLGRALGWSRGRIGALILGAGLGNTSFVGFPLIEALRGKSGLALAVLADQLGSFFLLAAGGIVVASIYSGRAPSAAKVVRRVLTFPAFLALLAGFLLGAIGSWPPAVEASLLQVGHTLSPLALFSVGLQLRTRVSRGGLTAMAAGLGWKMLVAPLLCLGIGVACRVHGLALTVGVLEAAMAPMISAAILADEYELEPALTHSLLGVGIALSFLTVPLASLWLP
jgi:predicted permease